MVQCGVLAAVSCLLDAVAAEPKVKMCVIFLPGILSCSGLCSE